MSDMMAISIRQPWAWLIIHGHKDIETRSWCPPYELSNKRIAIHAGKKLACQAVIDHVLKWAESNGILLWGPGELTTGALVGSVELSMVREYTDSDMFFEDGDRHLCSDRGLFEPTNYGWELSDPVIIRSR